MDVEKTIQFILDQQAELVTRMQQMGEAHAVLSASVLQLAHNQLRQQEVVGEVITIVGQLATEQRNLAQNLSAFQQRTDQKFQDVAENLNALIKIVDDLIRRDGQRS